MLGNIACAGVTGVIVTVILYPLDVVRTRLGVTTLEENNDRFFVLMKKIKREEGFSALYEGLGISCVGAFLYVGLRVSLKQ